MIVVLFLPREGIGYALYVLSIRWNYTHWANIVILVRVVHFWWVLTGCLHGYDHEPCDTI